MQERKLMELAEAAGTIAIVGHVRPDGDCLGSTLGLYNYLLASYPDIQAAVYLEEASSKFAYLKGYDEIHHETDDKEYELCICLDSSDEEAGKATIEGLRSAASFVRRELAHRVNLRNTPEIKFILDQSIEYGVNMSKLIDEVTKDLHDDEEEGLE